MRFRTSSMTFAVALALGAPLAARADDAPPSASQLRSAAKEYDEGRRLFVSGDFEQAAVHFENAYNDAPRAEALRNAIRARLAAKQFARAATLAWLASSRYPDDAATATLVRDTLSAAEPKLHAVTLSCEPKCAVVADGRLVSLADAAKMRIYLDPGRHELSVGFGGDRSKLVRVDARAGGKEDISVAAPPVLAPAPTATSTPRGGDVAGPRADAKPLAPVLFFALAGLTVVGGAATLLSGLDARANPGADAVRRDCVGLGESCPTYQKGRDAQFRTNVLLGATGGVALVTAVVGVFFTEWSSPGKIAPRTSAVWPLRVEPAVSLAGPERAFFVRGVF